MADLASQPTTIQSIYTWFREDKLYVNRRYQRKLVWTLEEKQKLIDSILKKYPIPAILIAEREESPGTYEIIDGLQRLHAIVSFIETTFPTLEENHFDLKLFPTAKSYADENLFVETESDKHISQKEVSLILDYTLALSVMRNAKEEEINDVFDRINTYGHRLSDQERRQAGVQNEFSNMVREIACTLRGDVSDEVLTLGLMPSISIDLPKTKHGYEIQAEEVFWVQQGILKSTDLRDSMDEQCIADIAACIVGNSLIYRSKDALDDIYTRGSNECVRVLSSLEVYGESKFSEEFKYCIVEIMKVCSFEKDEKLRVIIFKQKTTNAFPAVFSNILIAFHELFVQERKIITDYKGVKNSFYNLVERLELGRKAGSPDERRKNIDTIKGLVRNYFIASNNQDKIYSSNSAIDIQGIIRRSEIEHANYELKQGMLVLTEPRNIDPNVIDKVIKTICAIANNRSINEGKILIGVTDKDADAARVKALDKIEPNKIGRKFVVGVQRESVVLGISIEEYFTIWKTKIQNSDLSLNLKNSVLSNIEFNSFFGLGLIIITVPTQKELSYVGEELYWRNGDSTELAATAKQIASLAQRF